MGPVKQSVQVVNFKNIEPIALPGGSWSRMVLTRANLPNPQSAMGYSLFRPGSVTALVSHAVEELAFVVEGHGELRLEGGVVPFGPGDALYIPAHTWHAVANPGEEDVIMVFTFPYAEYPPTERR